MSAGLTAASGLMRGVATYETGQERSKLFGANAQVAQLQAQSEMEAGAYNENAVRMKGAAMQGQQIADIGASNLQQAGTPSQVVSGTRMVNEMDALQTRNNALRRAWGFQVQQASDVQQAAFYKRAGISGGVGSILAGGAKAAEQYDTTRSLWGNF